MKGFDIMSKLYLGDELIGSLEASDIMYDSSTTVKSKIDTLNTNINDVKDSIITTASELTYDNTTSELESSNVQDVIDELNGNLNDSVSTLNNSISSVNSNLAKYLPLNGGTMTGVLKAQTNTSYTTAQVRNIEASTSSLTAKTSALTNGSIHLTYT